MREGGTAQAALTLIDHCGRVALLKSFDHTGWWFRRVVGPLLIGREAAAYAALDGIPGVPRLLERKGRTSLVVELIDGRSCFACAASEFDARFFEQLDDLLASIRARGVVHGDVKRNVIRGQDGRPCLVDFGASFVLGQRFPWLTASLMNVAEKYDRRAVVKLKAATAPHLMTEADHERVAAQLPFERLVRSGEFFLKWVRQKAG